MRLLEVDNDPPLGASLFRRRRNHTVPVPPGSTLYLYTDGLVERRGLSVSDGQERLRRAALAVSPEVGCVAIMLALIGSHQLDDDVALLGVHIADLAREPFDLVLPTQPSALKTLRDALRRWLDARSVDTATVEALLVSVSEAATNAIRHATSSGAATFSVRADVHGAEVRATVRNEGGWRQPRRGWTGRGISLMEHLSDLVDVTVDGASIEVQIVKHLPGGTPR